MDKRKRYMVNKALQARYAAAFSLCVAAGMGVWLALFHLLASRGIEEMRWKMVIEADTLAGAVYGQLLYSGLASALACAALLYLASRYLLFKTGRSVARLSKGLLAVREGDLTKGLGLKMRNPLRGVSEELDAVVSSLREGVEATRKRLVAIRASVESLPDLREEVVEGRCAEIIEDVKELKSSLT